MVAPPEHHTVTIRWDGSKFSYVSQDGNDAQELEVRRTETVDWEVDSKSYLDAFAIHFRDDETPCGRRNGNGKLEKGNAKKNGKIEGTVRPQAIIGKRYKYFVAAYVNGEVQTDDPDMIVYE